MSVCDGSAGAGNPGILREESSSSPSGEDLGSKSSSTGSASTAGHNGYSFPFHSKLRDADKTSTHLRLTNSNFWPCHSLIRLLPLLQSKATLLVRHRRVPK